MFVGDWNRTCQQGQRGGHDYNGDSDSADPGSRSTWVLERGTEAKAMSQFTVDVLPHPCTGHGTRLTVCGSVRLGHGSHEAFNLAYACTMPILTQTPNSAPLDTGSIDTSAYIRYLAL